jgi:branched-chain amino acid transport system permease protein
MREILVGSAMLIAVLFLPTGVASLPNILRRRWA